MYVLLFVLDINTLKRALRFLGISVCPDVYLYLNSARSPVTFHFIQVFLPQVNWPLSNTAFTRAKEVCLCVLGLQGHKRKKEWRKQGGEQDLNSVWSKHLGQVH